MGSKYSSERSHPPVPKGEVQGPPALIWGDRARLVGQICTSDAPATRQGRYTANVYMQELPESVTQMAGSAYAMLSMRLNRAQVLYFCYQTLPNREAEMLQGQQYT